MKRRSVIIGSVAYPIITRSVLGPTRSSADIHELSSTRVFYAPFFSEDFLIGDPIAIDVSCGRPVALWRGYAIGLLPALLVDDGLREGSATGVTLVG